VAQLMNILPAAPMSNESPGAAKTANWAASSVTTVKMTAAAARLVSWPAVMANP